jgi:hypothetical protein
MRRVEGSGWHSRLDDEQLREPDMQDLRLIGVHEDGQHLLLADAEGGRYRLTLDEALRAAARRDRPRLGQLQIEIEGGMRPREVQAMIRRGLSAEEVADRAGWTVEKVRRFEGPVLAEREHVAQVAQKCAVGSRAGGPVTLAERVSERLRDRGVDRDDVEWDSSRDDDGVWQLALTFAAGGRQRTATWRYEPLGGSVSATNDEARWLSEDAAPGAIPTPHRAGGGGDSDVYDIDADGGVDHAVHHRALHEPIDLMAAMREHSTRGRRRRRPSPSGTPGDDRPRADALPIEDLATDVSLAPPPPAARGRNPVSAHVEEPTDSDELVGGWPEHDEGASGPVATDDDPVTDAAPRPAPARKGRPSVPSWDDIVFGTRGGGSG